MLLKSKQSSTPHRNILARFVLDCVENPSKLKQLYLNNDEKDRASSRKISKLDANVNIVRLQQLSGDSDNGRPAKFVGENARPVGEDNIGNKMLRFMGWTGGGLGMQNGTLQFYAKFLLGAGGQGIAEPIAQKMKFSRSGLG